VVSEDDLERQLEIVRSGSARCLAGVFGPGSMFWHIDREAAVFLGAGRALLLQLAHPWVAAAIAQHSRTLADPIGRFHRTFSVVFTMVFGTTEQALAAARRLHRRHAEISGVLSERVGAFAAGSGYWANDVAALRWVHATLIDTALLTHDLVHPPLAAEDLDRYWTEARLFAALFGIPQSALPQNWAEFAADNGRMWRSEILTVSSAARSIADALISRPGTRLRLPFWYRALSAGLLPPRLREGFGLRYGEVEQRAAERALSVFRRIYPSIPARLRFVGPYQEAYARLAGHPRPGRLTRLSNRLWIGQQLMPG